MHTSLSTGHRFGRRSLAALGVASLILSGVVSTALIATSAHAATSDIVINEVFSANKETATSDALKYDWVELKNTGPEAVDVDGWRIYDEKTDATKNYTIGTSELPVDSTTIPAGGYLVLYIADEPGLGKGDSVSLTTAAGDDGAFNAANQVGETVTWPVDTHANPSWARTDSGTYEMSSVATPGAANSFANDASASASASASGSATASASASDSASASASASASTDALTVEDWPGLQQINTLDNSGEFGAKRSGGEHTDGNLSGLAYQAAKGDQPAVLWAANNDLNPTIGNTEDKGAGGISKFVESNSKWAQDSSDGWTWTATDGQTKGGKQLRYEDGTGGVDSEGVTIANGSADDGVFVATERDNTNKKVPRPSIMRYDVSKQGTDTNGDGVEDLSATNEWNLTSILASTGVTMTKDDANLGLEGVAFVPDSYLTVHNFKTEDGSTYVPSSTSHFGGLFFAALEKNGHIYAVSVDADSDDVSLVKDIAIPAAASAAGFTVIQDLAFDSDSNTLWAQCDNSCGATDPTSDTPDGKAKLASYVLYSDGNFTIDHVYSDPDVVASANTEGFAIAPISTAKTVTGGDSDTSYRSVFFADDGVTDGYSLREGFMTAGAVTPTPTPSEDPTPSASSSATASATPVAAKVKITAAPTNTSYGRSVKVSAAVSATGSAKISGKVVVKLDGKQIAAVATTGKTVSVKLPQTTKVGSHKVSAQFVANANAQVASSSVATKQFTVTKAKTKARVTLATKAKKSGSKTNVRFGVDLLGTKLTASGKVKVYVKGKYAGTAKVTRGKGNLQVKVPKTNAKHVTVTVKFATTATAAASSATAKLRVK